MRVDLHKKLINEIGNIQVSSAGKIHRAEVWDKIFHAISEIISLFETKYFNFNVEQLYQTA